MKIRLLDKNYDITLISIEVEESFKHLKDFLFKD